MNKIIAVILAALTLVSCADPAFQQYVQNRQAAINGMRNGAAKYAAQETLDQQILADKQRQQQQAAGVALAVLAGAAAGANAYSAYRYRPVYVVPYYHPWWY